MTAALYPADFYADRRAHTAHAARRLLTALPPGLPRASLADIDCGADIWLAAALAEGTQSAFCIAGNWVTQAMLDDPRITLNPHDLEQPFTGLCVDLVLSLEVAEHLSLARAPGFVVDLVALASAVLFRPPFPAKGGASAISTSSGKAGGPAISPIMTFPLMTSSARQSGPMTPFPLGTARTPYSISIRLCAPVRPDAKRPSAARQCSSCLLVSRRPRTGRC
ncbi:MAG: hypothetical protein MO846_10120 [Candidatus Devosia symbiotica]|nr:hypothetical protein [Candidatus Devosia symbiotica]